MADPILTWLVIGFTVGMLCLIYILAMILDKQGKKDNE